MRATACVLAIVLTGAVAGAAANPLPAAQFGFSPPGAAQNGRPDRLKGEPQRDFRPRQPDREQRAHGRLTDEERRQLHRDLDKANRELYRRRSDRRQ